MWEKIEDTKGVIRIRKSKMDRKHKGQKKKDKRTNNDLQNTTHNTLKIEQQEPHCEPDVLRKGRQFLLY